MIPSSYFPPALLPVGAAQMTASQVIFEAASSGDVDEINRLLNDGLDPDWMYDYYQTTLLFVAVDEGRVEVVRELIKHHADVNKCSNDTHPLMAAVLNCHADVVEELLKAGVKPDQEISADGSTGLSIAAGGGEGWLDLVKIFLEYNANLDIIYQCSRSALMIAVQGGYLPIVEELVARGANVNAENQFGVSAYGLAYHHKHEWIASFLLEKGARKNKSLYQTTFNPRSFIELSFLISTLGIDILDDKAFSELHGKIRTPLSLIALAMRAAAKLSSDRGEINATPIPKCFKPVLLKLNRHVPMPHLDDPQQNRM